MSRRPLVYALLVSLVLWALIALIVVGVSKASTGSFRSPWLSVSCAEDPRLLAAGAAAVFSPSAGTIVLRLYVCRGLATLQDGRVTENAAMSLLTLSHELAHASGVLDEREADCYGWRIMRSVAHRIAVPAGVAVAAQRITAAAVSC